MTRTRLTSMVFIILVGATAFGLAFRGLGGDALIHDVVDQLALPNWAIFACLMGVVFLLGFFLDYIEIAFIHLPVIAPILSAMGFDPLWYGVLLGINLQTSFLTPPFGFALFYFRDVAPSRVTTGQIYRGIIPFVIIQNHRTNTRCVFPGTVDIEENTNQPCYVVTHFSDGQGKGISEVFYSSRSSDLVSIRRKSKHQLTIPEVSKWMPATP